MRFLRNFDIFYCLYLNWTNLPTLPPSQISFFVQKVIFHIFIEEKINAINVWKGINIIISHKSKIKYTITCPETVDITNKTIEVFEILCIRIYCHIRFISIILPYQAYHFRVFIKSLQLHGSESLLPNWNLYRHHQ